MNAQRATTAAARCAGPFRGGRSDGLLCDRFPHVNPNLFGCSGPAAAAKTANRTARASGLVLRHRPGIALGALVV
jgi:hypothetical protein